MNPVPFPPRGLTRDQAAAYCGVAPITFAGWVRRGIMPPPLSGTTRWDRLALDRAWDRASGIAPAGPMTEAEEALERYNIEAATCARAA